MVRLLCENGILHHVRVIKSTRMNWGILIIILIFINCNWVVTRWQWLFYMYTNMKNK